jgi:hypothetical protein
MVRRNDHVRRLFDQECRRCTRSLSSRCLDGYGLSTAHTQIEQCQRRRTSTCFPRDVFELAACLSLFLLRTFSSAEFVASKETSVCDQRGDIVDYRLSRWTRRSTRTKHSHRHANSRSDSYRSWRCFRSGQNVR